MRLGICHPTQLLIKRLTPLLQKLFGSLTYLPRALALAWKAARGWVLHEELLARGGCYAQSWMAQMEGVAG